MAGGAEKCDWAVKRAGFRCLSRSPLRALESELAAACPKGIDIYFENVGGQVFRSVVPLLNDHSRVPVCGLISLYNDAAKPGDGESAPAFMRRILVKRITMRGFIVSDAYAERGPEAFAIWVAGWFRQHQVPAKTSCEVGKRTRPHFWGSWRGATSGNSSSTWQGLRLDSGV